MSLDYKDKWRPVACFHSPLTQLCFSPKGLVQICVENSSSLCISSQPFLPQQSSQEGAIKESRSHGSCNNFGAIRTGNSRVSVTWSMVRREVRGQMGTVHWLLSPCPGKKSVWQGSLWVSEQGPWPHCKGVRMRATLIFHDRLTFSGSDKPAALCSVCCLLVCCYWRRSHGQGLIWKQRPEAVGLDVFTRGI